MRKVDAPCPACGGDRFDILPKTTIIKGEEMVIHAAFMDANVGSDVPVAESGLSPFGQDRQ
jgi:hypothetical protein